jgi:hypothetical protein
LDEQFDVHVGSESDDGAGEVESGNRRTGESATGMVGAGAGLGFWPMWARVRRVLAARWEVGA